MPGAVGDELGRFGALLRWVAALVEMEAFVDGEAGGLVVRRHCENVGRRKGARRRVVPIKGLLSRGDGWSDQASIFTFGVRDQVDDRWLLSAAELRPIWRELARRGVLLGQPVDLGPFGGLRIAVGARDATDAPIATFEAGIGRAFDMLDALAFADVSDNMEPVAQQGRTGPACGNDRCSK